MAGPSVVTVPSMPPTIRDPHEQEHRRREGREAPGEQIERLKLERLGSPPVCDSCEQDQEQVRQCVWRKSESRECGGDVVHIAPLS